MAAMDCPNGEPGSSPAGASAVARSPQQAHPGHVGADRRQLNAIVNLLRGLRCPGEHRGAGWAGGQLPVSDTPVWYSSGLPPAAIRWVLVRDPSGVRDPQAFLCTDPGLTPEGSSAASCSAGGSRPPSRKSASTWASRPSGNGRIRPSCKPPRRCSGSTRWSPLGHTG